MTWLFIAVALVVMAMALWLKRMDAHHERTFTDQKERLKRGDRRRASGSENSSHN
jgi:hypothetical protein